MENDALQVYASMNEANLRHLYEPEGGIFIAESLRVIARAMDAKCVPESFLLEDKYARLLEDVRDGHAIVQKDAAGGCQGAADNVARVGGAECRIDAEELSALQRIPADVPVYTAPLTELTKITGYRLTRGALCAMRRPDPKSVTEVLDGAARIAVLEHVTNPTNVGAFVRSAAALGMDGMLFTRGSADPFNRRAIRVSMGTIFRMPYAETDDALSLLLENGFTTVALALSDRSVPIDRPELLSSGKIALFLGSEDTGLSEETLASCDYKAIIPMREGVDSLNVANAAAIAFYVLGHPVA